MKKKDLWIKVDKILWEEWDPIGVKDYGGLDDEYRRYVPSIVALLQNGADESQIAKLLHQHANVNMGLSTRLEDHIETANNLRSLVAKS